MEQYVIKGGNPLVGEVEIGGAKNAALAILSAAIMTDETILIENLPDVRDINVLLEAIAGIGAQVERINRSTVKINGSTIADISVDYEYIKKIRASYYLLGALLGKYKHAEVPLPGGCNIGSRPIDQHLKGLPGSGSRCKDSSWGDYGKCGKSSRKPYFPGCCVCWRNHQHYDGSIYGSGTHDYRKCGQRASCS